MLKPRTRIRLALRAALARTYGYAALRVLRRGMRAAMADHLRRTLDPAPRAYQGDKEREAIAREYRAALRRLLAHWPHLDLADVRARELAEPDDAPARAPAPPMSAPTTFDDARQLSLFVLEVA